MNRVAVVTDSNSGITQSESKDLGVFVLPMPFLIDGKEYFEDLNLTQDEFYEFLEKTESISTSQPSLGEVTELWENVLKEYDEIVYIPMSSGLSKSTETAIGLAKNFQDKVFVVDNKRISVTMKQSVLDAKKLIEKGYTGEQIKNYLEETAMDSSIYITVNTMKYLKRGGRVTPAAAMIGSILHLKPLLTIQGDKLDRFALPRNMVKAKELMIEAMQKDIETRFSTLVKNGEFALYVAYTKNREAGEEFFEEVKKAFPNIPVTYCDPLSLSVSCHIGDGALAIACARTVK